MKSATNEFETKPNATDSGDEGDGGQPECSLEERRNVFSRRRSAFCDTRRARESESEWLKINIGTRELRVGYVGNNSKWLLCTGCQTRRGSEV